MDAPSARPSSLVKLSKRPSLKRSTCERGLNRSPPSRHELCLMSGCPWRDPTKQFRTKMFFATDLPATGWEQPPYAERFVRTIKGILSPAPRRHAELLPPRRGLSMKCRPASHKRYRRPNVLISATTSESVKVRGWDCGVFRGSGALRCRAQRSRRAKRELMRCVRGNQN
jgi:hypothetical protein